MFHPRTLRFLMTITLIAIGMAPRALLAQESTPATTTSATMEVVASGLTSPRGVIWGEDGTLFVALAGSGGMNPAMEDAPTSHAIGPWHGGSTAAVASINAVGCPVLVAGGLPSAADSTGGILGADDLAILGGQLYVSVDGGGPVHGNADQPSGVYRVLADGSYELVADLSDWVRNNPVSEMPGDFDPDAAGYSMVADEASGMLWVGDPNSGQILSVSPDDGQVSRVADLSSGHPVPTRLVVDPDGGVYVGTLTTVPFPDGTAKVMHVDADGTVSDVWTGLTVVTDVAIGADGSLYALEMSTGNLQEPPFLTPGSGQIVHQTGPDSSEVVASGLMFPIAMNMGSDGALYVSMPALGAGEGQGTIVRVSLDGSMAEVTTGDTPCAPLPETLTPSMPVPAAATPAAVASPAPVLVATPMPAGDMASPAASMSEPADTVEISISNFAYDPEMMEISAGTTVTWTNNDSTAHTATGTDGEFDTGAIQPGESASVTFDTPGTYVYVCQFHPNMQATIVVN